jgi:hypothetical protein
MVMEIIVYLYCAALLVSWISYIAKLFKKPRKIESKPVNPAAIHYPPYHPRCRGRLGVDINNQFMAVDDPDDDFIFDKEGNLVAIKTKPKGWSDGEKS